MREGARHSDRRRWIWSSKVDDYRLTLDADSLRQRAESQSRGRFGEAAQAYLDIIIGVNIPLTSLL